MTDASTMPEQYIKHLEREIELLRLSQSALLHEVERLKRISKGRLRQIRKLSNEKRSILDAS